MGRTMRWLRGLFGIKAKDKEERREGEYSVDGKQKGRPWISGRDTAVPCRDPTTIPPNITPAEAAWLRSFYDGSDTEQSKHAIAVAAATAAAADAAVAAAQAAVAVVRLTSREKRDHPTTLPPSSLLFGRGKWAALKIQCVFRGYLARKALRALKGLVKLQALMRGFLVRKQTAATLHSMQALIRAQASIRAKKMQHLITSQEIQPRISNTEKDVESGRRVSASLEPCIDEIPKIVEVDTGGFRPKSRSRRANSWMLDSGEDSFGKAPSLPSHPDGRSCPDHDWGYLADDCGFSTAQSTPRFSTAGCGCNGAMVVTPSKSVCAAEGYFRSCGPVGAHPNYMSKTQSFKAKSRSYSAPKQRPDSCPRRRQSLHQVMESRTSLSGVRMQRSCSQAQEAMIFKNAVMGKIGRSSDFVRENEFYHI